MEKCVICNKGMRPIHKTWSNPSRKEHINDWSGRSMHKQCWAEKVKRMEMVEYLKQRGFLDKNKEYKV
jgi:hypothetical protein